MNLIFFNVLIMKIQTDNSFVIGFCVFYIIFIYLSQADPQLTEILQKCEEKYKCEVLRCTTGRLVKGQEVWLALKSRINASVLNEVRFS